MNKTLKIAGFVTLLCYIAGLSAQEEKVGVRFVENKSFSEILSKAKVENKLVFIDCYTSWCGPCRKMAKDVFPQKEVGDYINGKFVAAKIDMELGEGPSLAKRFDVNAYPTLLFLNAEGEVLHRILGGRSVADFIKEVEFGLNHSDESNRLAQQYEGGNRSPEFLQKYLDVLAEQRRMNERKLVMEEYLKEKTSALLTDTLAFRFFNELKKDPMDSLFQCVYDRKEEFIKVYGPVVEERWWRVWFDYPERLRVDDESLPSHYDEKALEEYVEVMKRHRVTDYHSILYYYLMYEQVLQGNWEKVLVMAGKYAECCRVWDLGFSTLCSQMERYLGNEKSHTEAISSILRSRLKAIEGVKDFPEEVSLYYVEGKRMGPIGRARCYYQSVLNYMGYRE